MSTPVIRVKVTPHTVIKGKMDVRFPASVSAESPILLTKAGGSYSFGFDMNVVLEAVNFGGFVLGPASAVDGHFPQYDGTTGKKLKDGKAAPAGEVVGTSDTQALTNKTLTAPVINSPTGLVKADVGLGNVDNTSDATKNSAAVTLTNKTINASNNSISNLTTAMFAANVVDNDGTLAANSSARIPTQAAVKAYADQVVAATDAMVFKGVIDCSANPNYPAADRGWTYKVSVAGKIGGASGASVEVGDTAMCLTDGTASGDQATVGANWNIVQANLVGAVIGPASSTSGNIATFNGTGGTVIQDGGKALPSGALVGTSDTQTLTGKTIDTASNTFKLNGAAFGTATQATAALNALVGDTGSGGTKGLAPAPGSGDASAGKFLKADGTWAVPAGGGGSLDGAFGFRNRIINPNGKIWQRQNTGSAAITDGTYAFDRWYGLTQTAGVTASQTLNAENGTPCLMTLTQANATAQRFGIAQAIESANIIDARGQTVTLSARVSMSASTTLRYAVVEWTGTADTVTKDIVADWTNGTFTTGNFFNSTSLVIAAAGSTSMTGALATISLTGTISSSANNLIVFFWTDAAQAQNVGFYVGKVQLEIASSASALAVRSVAEELMLCQRYFEKSYNLSTAPGTSVGAGTNGLVFAVSANAWIFAAKYSVQKRVTPTITIYDGAGASGRNSYYNGSWANGGVTGTVSTNETSFYVNCVGAATAQYMGFDFAANAEL